MGYDTNGLSSACLERCWLKAKRLRIGGSWWSMPLERSRSGSSPFQARRSNARTVAASSVTRAHRTMEHQMAASVVDILGWFNDGRADKCTHLIVVCDTFDHDDYPVYVHKHDDFYTIYDRYTGGQNMQRIMEVYDLERPWHEQSKGIAHNVPPRPGVSASAEPK